MLKGTESQLVLLDLLAGMVTRAREWKKISMDDLEMLLYINRRLFLKVVKKYRAARWEVCRQPPPCEDK